MAHYVRAEPDHSHVGETLRNGERWLRSILEHASDLVILTDPEGVATYVSPASRRILGREAREVVGGNLLALVHPDDVRTAQLEFARLLDNRPSKNPLELRAQHASGEWRTLLVNGRNLLYDPTVGGIIINARDVTQLRTLEFQFQQVQKMDAVGRLAGGIAHDFCNMLSVVQGNAQLALSSMPRDAEGYREVAEISLAATRAGVLIRQLLTFSRRPAVAMEVLQPNSVIEEIQPLLQRLLGREITLTVTPDPVTHDVRVNRSQLEQILVNIVINARDAMPSGGAVTISTTEVEVTRDFVRRNPGARAGAHSMIEISDSGVGMPPDVRARIFEPFYTTKVRGKGTGLGLSTVYGIVQQFGGFILVESAVGEGSAFRIYLPRAESRYDTWDVSAAADAATMSP